MKNKGIMKIFNNKGFTLIELLVVIAIIGILASIMTNSLIISRKKANDAKRQEELKQLKSVLAIYYDEHDETYPDPDGANIANTCNSGDTGQAGCIFAASAGDNPLVPEYMSAVIKTLESSLYTYNQGDGVYAVYVQLEGYVPVLYFCIDSTGKSEQTTSAPSGTACP